MEFTTRDASHGITDEKYNSTVFKFTLKGGEDEGEKVKSRRHHLRLVSVPHRVSAQTTKKGLLPEWGFSQQEINGSKNPSEAANIWFVESVVHERIVNGTEVGEEQEQNDKAKNEPRLSFLQKFVELQSAMISHNAALTASHPYASYPSSWPFVIRGISFWEVKADLKQIYLLGNPLIWWFVITLTLFYPVLYIADRLSWRRGYDILGESRRRWWDRSTGFFFIAWFLHWIPFYLMGRQLFVHHYLPSLIYSSVTATLVLEFLFRAAFVDPVSLMKGDVTAAATLPSKAWMAALGTPVVYTGILLALLAAFTYSFWYFSPLVYGIPFPNEDAIRAKKWLSSWDFQHA
jgi:dolichyl-phosphate-mannose-protein mannosyltransferase